MKKANNRFFKIVASCMATIMSIGSIATPMSITDNVYAQESKAYGYKTCYINESTFPDPAFRKIIIDTIDRNHDQFLSQEDIYYGRNIWCNKEGIKTLKGIEYLVELRGLYCMNNEIKSMDLSKNKLITGVWCSGNMFTSLDFTPNPNLEWLYCFDCKITSLNIKNNPKMSYLEVNTNPLKKLDVTHNPLLEHLTCGSCGLKTLDLSNNPRLTHLDAFRNKFKKLDLSNNLKIKRLDIWDNHKLGSVDVSMLKGLQYYNCSNNNVKKIDVTHNTYLNKLICSYNRNLSKLDVTKNQSLVYLDCNNCNIKSLNVTQNPVLRFLQAFTNPFIKLNIGNNPYLLKTYKEGKKETNLPNAGPATSWEINYGGDISTGLDNLFFLCFDNKVKLSTKKTKKAPKLPAGNQDKNITNTKNFITRETFAEFLYDMAGRPSVSGLKSRFKDVKKGAWYENAVIWGEKNSICLGYPYMSSNKFGVGKYLSRQDLVLMLMRYSEYANLKRSIDFGRSDDYIDYYDIDFDHWEAICWSSTWNIMEGIGKKGVSKEEQRIYPLKKATLKVIKYAVNQMLEENGLSTSRYKSLLNRAIAKYKKYNKGKTSGNTTGKYKITSRGKLTVTYMGSKNAKSVKIADTVKIKGKKYKVTAIANNALKNNKKLRKVTIGKNVVKIGKAAFCGCKNLKSIRVKTTKLKKKSIGKNAFKKINKKAKFKVPKKKLKLYKKLIKKAKAPKKVKIVK